MTLEKTKAILMNIEALVKTRKTSDDEFVKLFKDNDELFDVIWSAYRSLEIEEIFLIAKHLGYCPLCLKAVEPYHIDELAEYYEVKPDTIRKRLNQAYRNYNFMVDKKLKEARRENNA